MFDGLMYYLCESTLKVRLPAYWNAVAIKLFYFWSGSDL